MKRKIGIQDTTFPAHVKILPVIVVLILMGYANTLYALTVTLEWTAPSGGGAITGYIACYGFQSGSYTEKCQTVESGTSCAFTDIDAEKDYYFAVKSYAESGESPFSTELPYRASAPPPVTPSTFDIVSSATTGGTITPSGSVSVTEGQNQSFSVSADSGYELSDLVVDGASVGKQSTYTFSQVAANHTIQAAFAIVAPPTPSTYTISAACGANGQINPTGDTQVEKGASLTVFITPSDKYKIDKLIVDGAAVTVASKYKFSNVNENHIISATFVKKSNNRPPPPKNIRVIK